MCILQNIENDLPYPDYYTQMRSTGDVVCIYAINNISPWRSTCCWSTNHEYTLCTSCYANGGLPLTDHQDLRDYTVPITAPVNMISINMHQLTFIVKGWTTFNLTFGLKGLFCPCHMSYSSLLAYFKTVNLLVYLLTSTHPALFHTYAYPYTTVCPTFPLTSKKTRQSTQWYLIGPPWS